VDYRSQDRDVWEGIFQGAPTEWLAAAPSELMRECARFLRESRVSHVLDLGSGFGRWSNFIAAEARCAVVGLDYAVGGSALARRLRPAGVRSGFVVGDVTALPFADSSFDGVVAVLILDNLSRSHGRSAVRDLERVCRQGAPAFVVLNPWPMPRPEATEGNPTAGCTRHDYSDDEALSWLLSGWHAVRWGRVEHQLRAFRMRLGG
jgi:ubiquinone/menaquinone biosynthesis C-methylase UbiE